MFSFEPRNFSAHSLLTAHHLLPMLFALDAIPLTEPRAGVGHYTYELALALAAVCARDEFELVYPSSYEPIPVDKEHLPRILATVRVGVGALGRRWFTVGLPRYLRRRRV